MYLGPVLDIVAVLCTVWREAVLQLPGTVWREAVLSTEHSVHTDLETCMVLAGEGVQS